MIRTTTADHTFTLPFEYEKYVANFEISYKQDGVVLLRKNKSGIESGAVEVVGNDICVHLKPNETKLFKAGYAQAQIRILTPNGKEVPSEEIDIFVGEVLDEEGGFNDDI